MPQREQRCNPVIAVKHQCGLVWSSTKRSLPRYHEAGAGPIRRALHGLVRRRDGLLGGLQVPKLMPAEDVWTERFHPEASQGFLQGDAAPAVGHEREGGGLDQFGFSLSWGGEGTQVRWGGEKEMWKLRGTEWTRGGHVPAPRRRGAVPETRGSIAGRGRGCRRARVSWGEHRRDAGNRGPGSRAVQQRRRAVQGGRRWSMSRRRRLGSRAGLGQSPTGCPRWDGASRRGAVGRWPWRW